ncbi:hypothetical protein GCM10018966_017100 [Streptomyces yanii]
MQYPAPLQIGGVGEVEAVRGAPAVEAQSAELRRHIVHQRRCRGGGMQPPHAVSAAGRDHLDDGGVVARRQRAPGRPWQRSVQVVRDQGAREAVQHIDPGGQWMAAQRREALGQTAGRDQIGGGNRELPGPQPLDDHPQQCVGGRPGT